MFRQEAQWGQFNGEGFGVCTGKGDIRGQLKVASCRKI
jgi:hypothetical protein